MRRRPRRAEFSRCIFGGDLFQFAAGSGVLSFRDAFSAAICSSSPPVPAC
jgi:hypothetical protein